VKSLHSAARGSEPFRVSQAAYCGETQSPIGRLHGYPLVSLTKDARGIVLNAERFHAELEGAVDDYLVRLADPAAVELREAFRKKMNFICNKELQPPAPVQS